MTALLREAALVCTALGILSALAVLTRARDVRLSVGVLLDFLLAAGLLQLSADPTVQALVTAAVIVALRRLLGFRLRFGPAMTKATG
jgi:uncharacterized membrane protein